MMKQKFFSRVSALAACLSLVLAVPAMAYTEYYEFPGVGYYFDPGTGIMDFAEVTSSEPHALTIPATIDGAPVRHIEVIIGAPTLTSITIPEGVVSLGGSAFALMGEGETLTEVILPNSLTELGDGAFYNCDNLVRVTLSNNLTTLGYQTFFDCDALPTVTLPTSLITIEKRAFEDCNALTTISLPANLTTIQDRAFRNCEALTSITIRGSLTTIGKEAFVGCKNLADVYYYGTPEQWAQIEIGAGNTNLKNAAIHYVVPVAGFTDVSSGDYYAQAVQWAVDRGVTSGTGASTFSPANTVTRAEAVTFLWRAAGSPEPTSTASSFTDVTDSGAYYYKAVLWATEQGITGGVGNNMFGLSNPLTYDQIFTFLSRAAGESLSGSDWSAAAVSWAQSSGLTEGLSFTATASCPRSDVVYCLWKQLA